MKQMKKYIALLLLAVIALSLTACGEPQKENAAPQSTLACDFSLHSGVTFGMTREEVIKKEEAAGFQMVKDMAAPDKATVSLGTYIDHFYDEAQLPDLFSTGTFAGIKDSEIAYWFNDQGQVFRMQYSLDCRETTEQDRQLILNILMEKYGEPTYSSEKNMALPSVVNSYPVTYSGWQREGSYSVPASWKPELMLSVRYEISNKEDITWVIPDENGSYVTIINHSFSQGRINYNGDGDWFPAWLITYTRLPKADFEQSLTTPSGDATIMQINDDL
ncbi:MAG: hypothetical protein IJO67_08105 [Clostridia bacterium]|nr:hypothetical protein [Clostridia bacterium]